MATSHFLGIIHKARDTKNECYVNFTGIDNYWLFGPKKFQERGRILAGSLNIPRTESLVPSSPQISLIS